MDADWSVELGHDDPSLEFPWSSPDGSQRYVDLRTRPELLPEVPEATQFPELGDFLRAIDGPSCPWLTAKCDVWLDHELGEAEAIYGANLKVCSYVDLVLRDDAARFLFDRHEKWAKSVARKLSRDDESPAACEFVVRRCWIHTQAVPDRVEVDAATREERNPLPGYYVSFYLFGYGDDEAQARARWAEGLRRVTGVLTALER
jgi:hypothetical protein